MKTFNTREEKLAFLKGLQNKTRSLAEISDGRFGHITYKNVDGKVVIKGFGDKIFTREEAKAMRNRTGSNLFIFAPKPGTPAYQMFEEDEATNPNIGNHIRLVSQAGNAPIEGEEED